jgi:hypothetical protein
MVEKDGLSDGRDEGLNELLGFDDWVLLGLGEG